MTTGEPYRTCPSCKSNRPVGEQSCGNIVSGQACAWLLIHEEIHDSPPVCGAEGDRVTSFSPVCRNGHIISPGDLFCLECGEAVATAATGVGREAGSPDTVHTSSTATPVRRIGDWDVTEERPSVIRHQQQFTVTHHEHNTQAMLTLYPPGFEPDPEAYRIVQTLPRTCVQQIIEMGHFEGRAWEVCEILNEGTVRDLRLDSTNTETIREFVHEVSRLFSHLSRSGLRHRDIRPEAILIRSRSPLNLVIGRFGSAQLSELDLELAAPLDVGRYAAPETVMGGISASTDWWGLGMILLEQLTAGKCFADADDQLFMIHVISHGVTIPDDLPPELVTLLRGLLAVDREDRWQYPQVQAWLAGEEIAVPAPRRNEFEDSVGPSITLGGRQIRSVFRFTRESAHSANWDDACHLLERGIVSGWAQSLQLDSRLLSGLEQLSSRSDISVDFRLSIALSLLDSALPLICREEIISPSWLLQNPSRGFALLSGPVPDLLLRFGIHSQAWLLELARRSAAVSRKSESLGITLNLEQFHLCSVISSRAKLNAIWDERRSLFPDANVAALSSVMDRRALTDEDMVLLASASVGQFRSVDEVVTATLELAQMKEISLPSESVLRELVLQSRLELYETLERRTEGFARCSESTLDEWVDEFWARHRLAIEQLLILLTVPESSWQKPQHQEYYTSLLRYFEKKVSATVLRGPLVRMTIGKTTPRIDLTELAGSIPESQQLLDRLLERTDKRCEISPTIFAEETSPESRLRRLKNHSESYLRDTGVNGLYLGFPFLVLNDQPGKRVPRLAPVLLWPMVLKSSVGHRDGFSLTFDRSREEVRLNPAFDGLLGPEASANWRDAARELLAQAAVRVSGTMDAFGFLGSLQCRELSALPERADLDNLPHKALIPAAVIFHVEFVGQSLTEDLKHLPGHSVTGTALQTMLRIGESESTASAVAEEPFRYFVADSDPSQEAAVAQAFDGNGVVVQGPPGTGKSQTIVNLVSDAIGRNKTVLVVCQKLPALDVVRKRLVAHGLQDRMFMVTDVNSDRKTILKDVREQLTQFANSQPMLPLQSSTRRNELLARIQALEQRLDQSHRAALDIDPKCGRSFTAVIDEILEIELQYDGEELPTASRLQLILGEISNEQIAALEDSCADVALCWLNSNYQDSPFQALTSLDHDATSISKFSQALQDLHDAELSRADVVSNTEDSVNVSDGELGDAWLNQNRSLFESLSVEELKDLRSNVEWFKEGAGGDQFLTAIKRLLELRSRYGDERFDLIELQKRLSGCTTEQVQDYAEFCAVNALLWLESKFTGNPLVQLRDQSFAPASVTELGQCLEDLMAAESERHQILQQPFRGQDVENPEKLQTWQQIYGDALSQIDPDGAQRISHLFSLFNGATAERSRGASLLSTTQNFSTQLSQIDLQNYSDFIGRVILRISPTDLASWFKTARHLVTRRGLFGWLNPARMLAFRRSRRFLEENGIPPVPQNLIDFGSALLLEQAVLHIRRDWNPPAELTGGAGIESSSLSIIELKHQIEQAEEDLQYVQNVVIALQKCPVKVKLDASVLLHPEAYHNHSNLVNLTIQRAQTRRRTLECIERLRFWMSESWCQRASEYVVNLTPPDAAEAIRDVVSYRKTAVPYVQLRQKLKSEDEVLGRIIEALAQAQDRILIQIETTPASDLLRAYVLHNGFTEDVRRLRHWMPTLLAMHPESLSDLQAADARLQRQQDIARVVMSCPCSETQALRLLSSHDSMQKFFEQLAGGIQRAYARTRSERAVKPLAVWMSDDWNTQFLSTVAGHSPDIRITESLREALPTLDDFLKFRRYITHADGIRQRCFAEFEQTRTFLGSGGVANVSARVRTLLRRAALLCMKSRLEQEHPMLLTHTLDLERKIESLRVCLQELKSADRATLTENYDFSAIRPQREWDAVTRLSGVRAVSLRQFFERSIPLGLQSIRPVWLMIPDVVSQLLPRQASLFDLVIFDEASQMPVEHSLPSLFRASKVVVSGDEKQMPPSSFFAGKFESDEEENEDEYFGNDELSEQERDSRQEVWNRREIKDCPNLLHLADSILPRTMLQIHYRSRYRELIAFSNAAFYGNMLSIPVVHPDQTLRIDRPIEFIPVHGVYSKQTNEAEAKRVVTYLESVWREHLGRSPSIGVVTFNRKQADLIEDLLEKRAEQDPTFRDALIRERGRKEHEEDMSLFVKNVENVQGDERDVIVFSTTFGRNAQGVFRRNFGILGQNGGECRLNVAITRARSKVALITSMPIPDISDMLNLRRSPGSPRDYIQGYLEYARLISDGEYQYADALTHRMSSDNHAEHSALNEMTGLKRSVFEFLQSLGYEVHRPHQDPVLGIDFAIPDPATGVYGVGIECTPPNHRLLVNARMREVWRNSLITRTYNSILKISGNEWLRNRSAEQQRIKAQIQSIIGVAR